ncbi:MAG: CoA transferase [Thermoflexaceae bacterium]|nr:CoA transferase [Thermoflexaceae bacterium]
MDPAPPVPSPHPDGPLAGYRVLDFADEKGQFCARFLAELGADVIKVEPREGDPTRRNGPFFRGEEGPETSLYWWAMNAGKRSVTCELRLEPGRALAARLAENADIVIETNVPGQAAKYGLDYDTLSARNPALIVVSITNFGQTGPYRHLLATDIVGSAMGGQMHLNGDDERGPLRTTAPQAYAQANVQAAVGATVALYARGVNGGIGQHVDVSMQEAMANAMDNAQQTWDLRHVNVRGPGMRRMIAGDPGPQYLFEARDGWITALQAGGLFGPNAGPIIDWLSEAGEARGLDSPEWREKLTAMSVAATGDLDYVEETMALFCKSRMKEELVAEAQRRGAGWAPVFSPREIVESKHLADRDFWVRVHHEDIGESFIYPGPPFRSNATPWKQRGRAPRVGEHNEQVYGELLGIDSAELRRLRTRMVI